LEYKYTLKQNLFYLLSPIFNLFHFFVPKCIRPHGISVMIRIKNEADWIQESLLSLNGFADEVVIIENNSGDDSYERIKKIIPQLEYKVILKKEKSTKFHYVSNLALKLTNFSWIFRWDGDFIAFTSGANDLKKLRSYILNLPRRNFYIIYPLIVNFYGDLLHVLKERPLHSENYIHSYHSKLQYVKKKNSFEALKIPFFYKIIRLKKIILFHVGTAKSLDRMLYRSLWGEWIRKNKINEFPSFKSYITYKFSDNLLLAKKYIIKEMEERIRKTVKFSKERYGDYPELMKPKLKNLPYKIIYKKDRPWSREDFIDEFSKNKN